MTIRYKIRFKEKGYRIDEFDDELFCMRLYKDNYMLWIRRNNYGKYGVSYSILMKVGKKFTRVKKEFNSFQEVRDFIVNGREIKKIVDRIVLEAI